jgi:hypothetical protein
MLTIPTPEFVVPLSLAQWEEFIGGEPRDIRGDLETSGEWQIPVSFQALAISRTYPENRGFPEEITLYGRRKMSEITQHSYELFGRVSINGKKRKAFASSVMFGVDGKLFEVAVIHVCSERK